MAHFLGLSGVFHKVAIRGALITSLGAAVSGCASYSGINESGMKIEGFRSPLLSTQNVVGIDAPTVHTNQIDALRNDANPNARCIGEMAAAKAKGELGEKLELRDELNAAKARATGVRAAKSACTM